MPWLRLSLTTSSENIEPVIDLLQRFAATSISISPADNNEPLFAEPNTIPGYWQQSTISALLHPDLDMDIVTACLRNLVGVENLRDHKLERVADKNWVKEFQASHGPLIIADKLCICPDWEQPPGTDLITVRLDPGLAFGTGTHPTTRMCLGWLVQNTVQDRSLLDFGCGSGVLALAAAQLGAGIVEAVDIDPQAVSACRQNIDKNCLQDRVAVSLLTDFEPRRYDILIANILYKPLLQLGRDFSDYVRPGGQIVLSGLLAVQAEECNEYYRQWFNMQDPLYEDEWALLTGNRKQI